MFKYDGAKTIGLTTSAAVTLIRDAVHVDVHAHTTGNFASVRHEVGVAIIAGRVTRTTRDVAFVGDTVGVAVVA